MADVPADVTQTKEIDILSKPTKSRETAIVTGVKRKLPEDTEEDVVLPRLTAAEGKAPAAKKDGGAPKKRTKKAADNRVIESEEQLAKLSLNSSIDGASDKTGRQKEAEKSDKVVCADSADKDTSKTAETNKPAEKPKHLDLSPIGDVPISLSLFQPLNAEPNTKEQEGGRRTPNTAKPSSALPKAKGTPGRKKAGTSTDSKLVISKQHPGLSSKRNTPAKAEVKKVNGVKVPNGKPKEKKETATKVQKTNSKGPKSQNTSNSIPKAAKQDVKDSSSQLVVNGKPPKSVKKKQMSTSDQQRPDESKKENEKVDKIDNSSMSSAKDCCPALQLSPVSNVPKNGEPNLPDNVHETPLFNFSQEPLTPLYGQTPKISGSSLEIPLPLRGHDNMKDTLNVSDFRHSMNGYSGSDQPLDLSPGSKEEYTQGKIFKTKMLKKTYPKSDTVLSQKERIVRQNGQQNGYVHTELNKATRTESQNS